MRELDGKPSISVHCDLKPSHFVLFGGKRRLVDYGSVRPEGSTSETPDGYSPAYCAPEVAAAVEGRGAVTVTRAIDTWSLGLILYEVFAEEPLLRGCYSPATAPAATAAAHTRDGGISYSNGGGGGGGGGSSMPLPPPIEPRTAEGVFAGLPGEQRTAYVRWLATGGAAVLVKKLEANAGNRLPTSCVRGPRPDQAGRSPIAS